MIWVIVFGAIAIAVVGAIVTVSYAIWLWHKASDLMSELEMVGRRAEELSDLLSRIELPSPDVARLG